MMRRKNKRRRRAAFGTFFLLVISALMLIGGVKLVVDNWTTSARASGFEIGTGEGGSEWQLLLVNRWNPIPEGYAPELTELWNGESVDSRIYSYLQEMFDDARAEGLEPYVNAGYRTNEVQQSLMDQEVEDYISQGYSEADAGEMAEQWVAVPGTSEHQLGLAVDISMDDNGSQSAVDVWQWLMENSYKYGFILRYPEDKTEITGIAYEPWHYRYVGKEAAKEIYRRGVCLEEYLGN